MKQKKKHSVLDSHAFNNLKKEKENMGFIKKLGELAFENNLDVNVVEYIYKQSDVYKQIDMADYFLRDDDKLPMSLVDGSKLISNDYIQIVEASKYYMESALANAKGLIVALEKEIEECDDQLQFNKDFPNFYNRSK
tara:strand:- start:2918 stop:3328 length:411 start_codon:yes stop_codon:yes gene_type:complete